MSEETLTTQEQYDVWKALPLSEKMRADIAMASAYADDVKEMETALRLLLAPPAERLAHCKAEGLFPDRITATESVDSYWRKVIVEDALRGEGREEV